MLETAVGNDFYPPPSLHIMIGSIISMVAFEEGLVWEAEHVEKSGANNACIAAMTGRLMMVGVLVIHSFIHSFIHVQIIRSKRPSGQNAISFDIEQAEV
jgi:hypothetical protein